MNIIEYLAFLFTAQVDETRVEIFFIYLKFLIYINSPDVHLRTQRRDTRGLNSQPSPLNDLYLLYEMVLFV